MTGDLNTAFGHRHYMYSAALLIFMRRTDPFEPLEPIEPDEPLSHAIKGRPAPRATPLNIILSTNDSIYDNIIEYIHDGVVRARRRERSKKNIR